jgi:O-antigen ligase
MSTFESATRDRGGFGPDNAVANPLTRACDWSFDAVTVGVLVVAPLFMGGRHPLGRLVYVAAVAAMALLWLLARASTGRIRYRHCGLEWLMLLASGVILFQFVPLPAQLLSRLSPRIAYYLPLWNSAPLPASPVAAWRTLSLVPASTRIGLTVWAAHVMFLLLLVQRVETWHDARRLIRWVALSGVVLAAVGMLQYLFSNGKFLWVYQDPFRGTRDVVRGPFYNENHFAHLLSLTLIPILIWIGALRADCRALRGRFTLRSQRRGELLMLLLAIAWPGVLFTILLTRSRGGVIAALVAVVLGAAGIVRREGIRGTQALGLAGVIVVLVAALSIHGLDQVGREVETLTTMSIDQIDQRAGRRKIWQAAREIVGQFTLCGAGVGSFRETFPLFYAEPRQLDYSYAESGVLQVAAETGLLGTALLIVGLMAVARAEWAFWRRRTTTADDVWALAAAVGLCVSLLHSLFDFVWYLPACLAITLALLAVLIRWEQLTSTTSTSLAAGQSARASRMLGAATLLTALTILLTGIGPLFSAARASSSWTSYLVISRQQEAAANDLPVDPTEESLMRYRVLLNEAVRHDPDHARAHLRLASHALQLFELRQAKSDNPMSLAQIRDAALASRFASREAQDRWLEAAVGANRALLDDALVHTRKSLELSPLQGVAYVYLAELAFLQSPGTSAHAQLVYQALRVRPYDPAVLFAAGREAIFAGDVAGAVGFWRHAYYQDNLLRQRITHQLAPQLPADVFIAQFRPDPLQMLELIEFYRQTGMAQQAADAGRIYLDRLAGSASAQATFQEVHRRDGHLWREAYSIAAALHDSRAVALGRRAVELNPNDYTMRRRLAFELLDRQAWEEAVEQLSWCRDKQPRDRTVATKLRWARQQVAPELRVQPGSARTYEPTDRRAMAGRGPPQR